MLGEDTWGIALVLWFQSWRTPLIEALVIFFHEAGEFTAYMLLLPLFFWSINRRFGARLLGWFLVGAWLNFWLKEVFRLPRPYSDQFEGVENVIEGPSFGLPSGHTQQSILYWGWVATWARRRWVTILVALYALLMGLSRVAGGAHFPQDVIAGWLLGLIWLALYIVADRPLSEWLAGLGLWAQVALSVVAGAGMVALLPSPLGGTLGATTLGFGIGLALGERWAKFDAGGDWWQRVVRYLIGVAGVAALRFGLDAAFDGLQPALLLDVIQFGLVGIWVAFGAPWVFLRAALAGPAA